jgi:Tfp pilus assembly protein PilO
VYLLQDGTLQLDELLDHLRTKLPSDEDIRLAVLQAMEEAGKAGSDQGLDFTAFMVRCHCG